MKRRTLLIFICLLFAGSASAQSSEKGAATEPESGSMEIWKWANFLLLAGGLGYVAVKNGGPFFNARSRQIRKAMIEAGDLRKDAEARSAEVDRRLANLEMDIARLREESQKEAEAQTQRAEQQAAAEIARIETHAQQEIDAAGKSARLELKRYAGELALSLAEQKIRARMTPDAQDALVRSFVRDLDHRDSKAQTN